MGQQVRCAVSVDLDETVYVTKSLKNLTALIRARFAEIVPKATLRVTVEEEVDDLLELEPFHRGTFMVLDALLRRLVDNREAWCAPTAKAVCVVEEEEPVFDDGELEETG